MEKIEYFNYRSLAIKKKVGPALLEKIEKEVRKEFSIDRMMFELHMLRAINSRYWVRRKNRVSLARDSGKT